VTDDDRIRYLTGEPVPLEPDERGELDDLRGLLSDPAVWVEPGPGLERGVAEAIAAEHPPARAKRSRGRMLTAVAGVAAAAAIAVGIAVGVSSGGGSRPTTYQAALSGTRLDPGAIGQATLVKTLSGWRVTLHAIGLPRLDNGQYYQAWLKNPAGVLVTIGTFNQPDNVTLWSGVPPTDFPTLTVTRQLANGNPASSGLKVLTGTAHPAG
jgi:Anti-sigma-K factor rskA